MALRTATIWEVRASADANNGGGFDSGYGGVDFSQQDSAQLTLADGSTSSAVSTTLTSATGGFTSSMVGNILYISSGTNASVNYFLITEYTDANNVVLDRAPSNGGGAVSDANFKVGGALNGVEGPYVKINAVTTGYGPSGYWIKSGTYVEGGITPKLILGGFFAGYKTTRGDNPTGSDRPLFDGDETDAVGFDVRNTNAVQLKNLIFQNYTSHGIATDEYVAGYYGLCRNVRCTANGSDGINTLSAWTIVDCELDNNGANGISVGSYTYLYGCYVHDNTAYGIYNVMDSGIFACVVSKNNIGINGFFDARIINCIIYNNVSDGIEFLDASNSVVNCIITDNGGYGINPSSAIPLFLDYNCFYNNYASINGVSTSSHDILADPLFTNASAGNFTLQTSSPCKNVGFPSSPLPGGIII